MNKLKTAVFGSAALVAGVLTLGRLRGRRAKLRGPSTPAEAAGVEARAATDAGREALDHAGTAASHGLDAARSLEQNGAGDSYRARGSRRLRGLGKGWARQ